MSSWNLTWIDVCWNFIMAIWSRFLDKGILILMNDKDGVYFSTESLTRMIILFFDVQIVSVSLFFFHVARLREFSKM